jgi:hypothetical protein
LFNERGRVPLAGFRILTNSLSDQMRNRMIDRTVNEEKKVFVDAQDYYQEINLQGQGSLVVWDQQGGYHDVLLYADKVMKDRKRDIKEIAVLQHEGEFEKGLHDYLTFLLSGKYNGDGDQDDVQEEIGLAAQIDAHIKAGRLKILCLPSGVEVTKVEDEYDLSEAIRFFEPKADMRNCGRMVFVSDWRKFHMDKKHYRTTIELISNLNLFVTTIDGVLRIATYAARQA